MSFILMVYILYMCIVGSFRGFFFFFKQKTAYEMRISDWSSDVCSSDLLGAEATDIARRRRDRLQLGIFLRDLDEAIAGKIAGRHQRLQFVPPRLDLRDPFGGDLRHRPRAPAKAGAQCCEGQRP